jgi:eukaryotic-like serine/threonine-protein kinase
MEKLIDGRYRIESVIGKGGMGVVYVVYDRLTMQKVALKQVNVEGLAGTDGDTTSLRVRLVTEFQIMASLHHPFVMEVFDYGLHGEPYFTMPYLEDAESILDATENMSFMEKINQIIDLLQALQYLHRRGVIHRDLKPNNILINNEGVLQLLDFGLAVKEHKSDEMVGTIAYMSPEALAGETISEQSDLFSVGVLAYELLTRHHPFHDKQLYVIVRNILENQPDYSALAEHPMLCDVLEKLLEKHVTHRYQTADEVIIDLCQAFEIPLPSENQAIRDSFLKAAQFVGRKAEMRLLKDALYEASDESGSAWLIGGESGIGKTRLLDEIRVNALVKGALVLRGTAMEGGGLPMQLWRDILRRMALVPDLTDQEASVFKHVIPEIDQLLERSITAADPLGAEDSRQRLAATILSVLRRQKRPVLLLLEDIHWGLESIDLLKRLVNMINVTPILLVASYRTDEYPELPELLPIENQMILERLSPEAIAELSLSMLGEAGSNDELVGLITRETEGNTFFIIEGIRSLAEQAGRLSAIGQDDLPDEITAWGMQDIIRKRLGRVPLRYRGLLRLIALGGRKIDVGVLHHLAELYMVRPQDWLTDLANLAILETRDNDWQFAHDKLRKQLLADITDIDKRAFHQQIAEAIEFVHLGDLNYAPILQQHWFEAGNPLKERFYAATAAAQTLAVGDYIKARELFTRVLLLTPEEDVAQKSTVLVTLATICSQLSDFDAANEYANQAIEVAEVSNRVESAIQAYCIQAAVAENRANFEDGVQLLQQALDRFGGLDNPSLKVQVLTALATVLVRLDNLDTAETHLDQVADHMESLNDRILKAEYQLARGILEQQKGNITVAEMNIYDSLIIFESVGNYGQTARTRAELGRIAFIGERYAIAISHLELALQTYRELGDKLSSADCLTNLGKIYLKLDETETAREYFEEAIVISTEIDTPWLMLDAMLGGSQVLIKDAGSAEEAALVDPKLDKSTSARSTQMIIQKILMQVRDRVSSDVYDSIEAQGTRLNLKDLVQLIDEESRSEDSDKKQT